MAKVSQYNLVLVFMLIISGKPEGRQSETAELAKIKEREPEVALETWIFYL